MGFIYKITNSVNGKVYIGKTMRTIPERWKEHIRDSFKPGLSYTSILHCSIRKHGVEAFSVEQVEECDNKTLNDREKYWISQYNSMDGGYNISLGGGGWMKCSDEELLALWNDGNSAKQIAEEIELCYQTVTRRLKTLGILQEDISKRATINGHKLLEKPVYQYNLDGYFIREFPSLREAQKSINGQRIKFQPATRKTIGGYQWRKYKTDKIESVKRIQSAIKEIRKDGCYAEYS